MASTDSIVSWIFYRENVWKLKWRTVWRILKVKCLWFWQQKSLRGKSNKSVLNDWLLRNELVCFHLLSILCKSTTWGNYQISYDDLHTWLTYGTLKGLRWLYTLRQFTHLKENNSASVVKCPQWLWWENLAGREGLTEDELHYGNCRFQSFWSCFNCDHSF